MKLYEMTHTVPCAYFHYTCFISILYLHFRITFFPIQWRIITFITLRNCNYGVITPMYKRKNICINEFV